jgi:AcrR family transcriptional regulator
MTRPRRRGGIAGRPRDGAVDEAILKTAIELFVEHGVEGANFDQIAKRSGTSRASIYRRWNSKEELLASALRSTKKTPAISPETIAGMSPGELIGLLRETFVDALTQSGLRELIAQLIGSLPIHPELLAIYREEFIDPLWGAMWVVLEKAVTAGVLPRLPDQELLRDLMSGAITHRLLMQTTNPRRKTEAAWVERLLHQLGLTVSS